MIIVLILRGEKVSIIKISQEELDIQDRYCDKLRSYFENISRSEGRVQTYQIRTYGCQLNESDSEKMAGYFDQMGLLAEKDNMPDILLMNTCAIRENAEDRLFGNLGFWKALKTNNPGMIIIVCGCMTKQEEDLERIKRSFSSVDLVFGPQDIHLLPQLLFSFIDTRERLICVSENDYLPDDFDLPVVRHRKFRALVPIMYGCDNFCTYCIVPYTRGRERSRSFEKILLQLKDLSDRGFREVMLLGQNVNSYGKGVPDSPDFPDLLRTVAEMNLFSRVRFMTSNPKDMSDRLIGIIAANPCIERHIHLPFQSGSNAVLKNMNRGYTREQYLEKAKRYRDLVPKGTISTDIIVGFPGETEDDFLLTLDLMEQVRFDAAFTFIYSKRPGTKAASFSDVIPDDIIGERFSRLLELQNSHSLESNQSVVGELAEVLIEGVSHTNETVFTGRTSTNRLINFTIPDHVTHVSAHVDPNLLLKNELEGEKAMVRLLKAKTFSIEGRLESFLYE